MFSKAFTSLIVIGTSALVLAQPPPMFNLNCTRYPDVCDNHCNAFTCHGLNGVTLHRDETAGDTGDDDRRRTAIGCGSNNYCASGTDCDEFPYASTFDGGLGCYPDGFTGNAGDLVQSGTTRCVDPSQNSAHGSDLSNFYANFSVGNSDPLYVAIHNLNRSLPSISNADFPWFFSSSFVGVPTIMPVSPLCDALATQGDLACPDESSGPYRFRTTPATPSCPARGSRTARDLIPGIAQREAAQKREEVYLRTVYTDANQTIRVFGGRDGEGPVVGGKVWTARDGGDGFVSTIIRVV